MEIIRLAGLLSALIITGCQSAVEANTIKSERAAPEEWYFTFITPKALPALVTYAIVMDTKGNAYSFKTLDKTHTGPEIVGSWGDRPRNPPGYWNKIQNPPKYITFCWDSIIDKKVYETRLSFSASLDEKMRKPAGHKNYRSLEVYYDMMIIGLAPEGKVTVWLQDVGKYPNYLVTPSSIKTLSGEQLDICKGITKHPNGYKYYGETPDFIKGKTYPYGNW
ncbi:DUF2931 family protein [Ewingella americana]|uniref:DUF2931 family protein n=1 Tax=Ewingella americana TaxID=41202 RepID=UPI0012AD8159|nr:DUF2931 family protein [Ewingella americana]MRT04590.1 DUF2931 family protein [Ewingella americana]